MKFWLFIIDSAFLVRVAVSQPATTLDLAGEWRLGLDSVMAENPDRKLIRADMHDTWTHGLKSMPLCPMN